MALAMLWLKAHEDELVFAGAIIRQHLLDSLPADAKLTAVPVEKSPDLAGLVFRAEPDADNGLDTARLGNYRGIRRL